MAGVGPPPAARKRRRNADPVPQRTLQADNRTRGPRLPGDVLPDGEEWHPRTQEWWSTWRKSAQAREFTATDWDFLLDTALMHHTMWAKARWEFAAELRLRAAKFGATPEDRMRLRMTVETPGSKPPTARPPAGGDGSVTDIRSRRARLSG
ncbi:phage terminase small subunit [Pseudonocardia asaccharolytica]|uniref:Terminase small subunit n=1 Tax=Pseudonocardia asaccharolytica DSM 44247 = NBRC 16224 TaxID=1123024 RepID=A0A511D3I6_9PSEU|nr:hypothetical protein [Pseudonocardia asaccharolytica]GEL19349.1 hypothetical protein PA7_31860 [Pseudonocardia asaccharolytica DSM 44247 = NBRC 16224]